MKHRALERIEMKVCPFALSALALGTPGLAAASKAARASALSATVQISAAVDRAGSPARVTVVLALIILTG